MTRAKTAALMLAAIVGSGCRDDGGEQIQAVRAFVRALQHRDVTVLLPLLESRAMEQLERSAERARNQVGGRSNIVPPETQEELKKTLPNAQLITVPDVGHYPSDEKPDEVMRIVSRFLAGERVGN